MAAAIPTECGQIVTAWAPTKEEGLNDLYHNFRMSVLGWKAQSELPNPANFTSATQIVTPEDLEEKNPAGSDVDRFVEGISEYRDAGVTRLAVTYPGQDFDGYFDFWRNKLRPALE